MENRKKCPIEWGPTLNGQCRDCFNFLTLPIIYTISLQMSKVESLGVCKMTSLSGKNESLGSWTQLL